MTGACDTPAPDACSPEAERLLSSARAFEEEQRAYRWPEGTLFLDGTRLASLGCTTKAVLREVWGLAPLTESRYLVAGRALHVGMEYWLAGATPAQVSAAFTREYREWAEANVPRDDRLWWEPVSRILARWAETHPIDDPRLVPFGRPPLALVEAPIAEPLERLPDGRQVVVTGRIDAAVPERLKRAWRILDHKSAYSLDARWRGQWTLAASPTRYLWLAERQLTPRGFHVMGFYINGIELPSIPGSERTCKKHGGVSYAECGPSHAKSMLLAFSRPPEMLVSWERTARALGRRFADMVAEWDGPIDGDTPEPGEHPFEHAYARIADAPQEGLHAGMCGDCAFRPFCEAGRPSWALSKMYRYAPWRPYEEAFRPRALSELVAGPSAPVLERREV